MISGSQVTRFRLHKLIQYLSVRGCVHRKVVMDAFIVWDIDMLATLAQVSDFEGVKVGFTLSNAQQIVRLARKDSLEDIRLLD